MRLKQFIAIPMVGLLVGGCFNVQPVERATPQVGNEVVLEINDAGRVALAPTMGPGIDQIRGHLVGRDSQEFVVAVSDVQYLHMGTQPWAGALSHIGADDVNKYYQVVFSPVRTLALGAAVVVGGAIAASQLMGTSGSSPGSENTGPPPIQRIPPGLRIPLHPVSTLRALRNLLPHLIGF